MRVHGTLSELIQPLEPDIQTEHDAQDEFVQAHDSRHPSTRDRLFHQCLKTEFLQHRGYGQQSSVRSQILSGKVIRRRSPDFIGFWMGILRTLSGGRFLSMLFLARNHLGDLLG